LAEQGELLAVAAARLKGQHIAIELEQMRQRTLVARHLPIDPLLVGIAPAGVYPDLGINPNELAVEGLRLEFEVGFGGVGPGGHAVVTWLFNLDQWTAGRGE